MASSPPSVEAKSLSSINFLAANPPQYPNNPTQKGHESLTLYISRVPGTRDVILSTFRPQRKNVTGEDVANSLYYVHLDHPDDELLVPPKRVLADEATPRSSGESQRSSNQIKRKPLPANARLTMSRHGSETSEQGTAPSVATTPAGDRTPRPSPKDDSATSQKEVRFLDVPTEIPQTSYSAPSSPQASRAVPMRPHPNGPRPAGSPHPDHAPAGPNFDNILSTSPGRSMRPPSPARMQTGSSPRRTPGPFSGPPEQPPLPPRPRDQLPSLPPRPDASVLASSPQPFSLTLIRRDPTTGSQWTVGKVASIQSEPAAQGAGDDRHGRQLMGHPINVNIQTSGYAKYRNMPSRDSVDVHRLSASSASLPQSIRQQAQQMAQPSSVEPEEGFNRQVLMSYSKGLRAGLKQKFHRHHNSDAGSPGRRPGLPHGRQDSMNSVSSNESGADSPPSPTVLLHPAPGYRPAGYVFKSPWDGRCEFRTGNAGRSLKLRHVLHDVVATGDPDPMKQVFGPGAAPMSELRFNLPNADLFGNGRRGKIARDAQDKFNKYIRRGSYTGTESSDDQDDWELEMIGGVGREDAGGGNRGKRVKMGKLIVHDEGIKILDLVVAANIGVWWSSWEKNLW